MDRYCRVGDLVRCDRFPAIGTYVVVSAEDVVANLPEPPGLAYTALNVIARRLNHDGTYNPNGVEAKFIQRAVLCEDSRPGAKKGKTLPLSVPDKIIIGVRSIDCVGKMKFSAS